MVTNPIPINSKRYLLAWLQHLTHDEKLDVITLLSQSLKSSDSYVPSKIDQLYGAWADDQTAEAAIDDLRKARTFNRLRENF